MKIAIISDIHSNLEALKAVLGDISADKIYCLGDIVGYGPRPNECINLLKERADLIVAGNHDFGSVGQISMETFTFEAQFVCNWTKEKLALDNFAFLKDLKTPLRAPEKITLFHGSLNDPFLEYILTQEAALKSLKLLKTPVGFFGHTHLPIIFKLKENKITMEGLDDGQKIILDKKAKYLINPGSIGQPRDGNPKSSYIVFENIEYSLTCHRVEYDIKKTQNIMRKKGLPPKLIERLKKGL